ncbi:MAG TPA: radical SAM protein, partial [Deinococcales bacterium]|nr:radical SAM protein [Deinococcales bacterium]
MNVLPSGRKVCTFDCPYCECGLTRGAAVLPGETTSPTAGDVLGALEVALSAQAVPLDAITFAGNGEPTLHPEFERVAAGARALRDRLAPRARLALLTNGIRLAEPGIRAAALDNFEDVEVKLDAGTPETFARVAAPTVPWSFEEHVR